MEAPPIQPNPGQQVIILQEPQSSGPRVYERYPSRISKVLGITRVVIGILCIILQTAATSYYHSSNIHVIYYSWRLEWYSNSGTGIWCGVCFIVAGSFGIAASKTKTLCVIVTHMILSIISVTVFSTIVFLVHIGAVKTAVLVDHEHQDEFWYIDPDPDIPPVDTTTLGARPLLGLYVLLMIAGLIQAISDIVSSILCCKTVCCNTSPSNAADPDNYTNTYGGSQVVYLNNPNPTDTKAGPTADPAFACEDQVNPPPAYTASDELPPKHPLP